MHKKVLKRTPSLLLCTLLCTPIEIDRAISCPSLVDQLLCFSVQSTIAKTLFLPYEMLHSSDVSIFFFMTEFCGRTSMGSTINALCLTWFMLVYLATTPTITSSIIERAASKGDVCV